MYFCFLIARVLMDIYPVGPGGSVCYKTNAWEKENKHYNNTITPTLVVIAPLRFQTDKRSKDAAVTIAL